MGDVPVEPKGINVCVRVRPLNQRELDDGNRVCTHYDAETKQIALTAVDKNTLLQLKGAAARGFAFDRHYSMDDTSDTLYRDLIEGLVDNIFKGYNGTVLAYGQTGSGKTHTMSGGTGHYGVKERGVTPRVIDHVFQHVAAIRRRLKPGEDVSISASAVEIYNEEFRDLSKTRGKDVAANHWDSGKGPKQDLKLQEIPTGQGNRVRAEVSGLYEQECSTYEELMAFFQMCFENRSTSSTNLNASSSRSHALFTINVHRVVVTVGDGVDEHLKARVRTEGIESKLHLVDLAGSERVKRSGVEGKQFREATKINSGLLALGNVIVALADNAQHIPYRTSKLTRLIQDSLGGNSLTVLITCISPSEADFEETNNTLKYANRACSIQNQPLPNKFLMMEEDLLPTAPGVGMDAKGVVSIEALLEENFKQKELRERRRREKEERERLRREALSVKKEQLMKTKGYQRLLAQEYDRKLKEAQRLGKRRFNVNETVDGQQLLSPDYNQYGQGVVAYGAPQQLTKESSTGSAGNFNLQQFIRSQAEGATTASGISGQHAELMDTGASAPPASAPAPPPAHEAPPKNLSPALARALARKKAQAEASGAAPPSPLPSPQPTAAAPVAAAAAPAAPTPQPAAAAPAPQPEPHTPDLLDHAADEDEPLAAELEAQVREAAERAALQKAAEEAGEKLDDEPSALDEDEYEGGAAAGLDGESDEDEAGIVVLARFKVNKHDVVSVFKATTKEDFKDVVKLLPENTPLPASNKMTYLIARLELHPTASIDDRIAAVNAGRATMGDSVGPAVGCLMATFGTNMISSCIFDFDDPEELEEFAVEERIELWGLQIPHNSMRPVLKDADPEALAAEAEAAEEQTVAWSSVDRLNMSVGLLYALCVNANASNVRCGFCVPRSQLLRRWQGAGVRMKEVTTKMRLIYPPHAHDFEYYKSSTVAYFLVDDVADGLTTKLALMED